MGPYCKFCERRCFVHLSPNVEKLTDKKLKDDIYEAYGKASIIATCSKGQEFEQNKLGWNYDKIVALTQIPVNQKAGN